MNKYQFDCKKCDIGYILKNYIKPLIQTLTNDIKSYYMRLLTTKCLNTAVMLAVFMVGKKRALQLSNYCDTEATRKRHMDGKDQNYNIINTLRADVFTMKTNHRWLYYILLTDGHFPHESKGKEESQFFPGHVFILEKIPDKHEPFYYFYQSYINEYDLKDHIKRNNKSLKICKKRAENIIDDLEYILNAQIWDVKCVQHWRDLTFIDSSHLLNYVSKNNFFICYKKAKLTDCLKYIKIYTKEKLKEIEPMLPEKSKHVYGDATLYENIERALTYNQVYNQLKKLQDTLNLVNKYKCQLKSQI